MLSEAASGAGLDVAGEGDLKGDAGGGEMVQKPRVVGAADAVPDALGTELEGVPHALRAGRLAGVDRGREAVFAG